MKTNILLKKNQPTSYILLPNPIKVSSLVKEYLKKKGFLPGYAVDSRIEDFEYVRRSQEANPKNRT